MNNDSKLIFEAYLQETKRETKQYVLSGKLDPEIGTKIINADPHPKKSFSGWMSRQWMAGNVNDIDTLRNTVEEFYTFLQRRRTSKTNIGEYKTFQELQADVDKINATGEGESSKELESSYEVLVDNENLLVVVPHTHEASRKLGLTQFAYRSCADGKDSAWCVTYKSPDHWNDYYYGKNVTFYYIKIKSPKLMNKVREAGFPESFVVTALLVKDNTIDVIYDGLDKSYDTTKARQFIQLIGLK